ncbi:hypothetical protein ISF26_10940 [Gloeobacter morelensis MG652769]|uniref:Uncharacterized protein n=2 Tax=Gloeobacter TaxID=33071 RepID=A0ABY3PSS6_9CYAN|nr:hypothetical protein ISF26_10940 [Gloeobacter morelensis MG652769]
MAYPSSHTASGSVKPRPSLYAVEIDRSTGARMLSQIVRPMVHTQIRLLAGSAAPRSTLVNLLSQWLGFLGVRARVTHLEPDTNRIYVSFCVEKPEACDPRDWQHILGKLRCTPGMPLAAPFEPTPAQQSQLHRLLAHMIQAGQGEGPIPWENLRPQLMALGFDEATLAGIRSQLSNPQPLEAVLADLDPDVAALALARAVGIAMLDRRINPSEDSALNALLQAMGRTVS